MKSAMKYGATRKTGYAYYIDAQDTQTGTRLKRKITISDQDNYVYIPSIHI